MSRAPQVSVVIPVHNGARHLGEAIDSALAQTHPGVEIVVVDDASTDGTSGVIARYADRVRALRHAENRGPSAARNTALGVARGAYVAFLDSDDRFLPAKVARQAAVLDARPEIGIVYTGWRCIDEQGRPVGEPVVVREQGDLFATLLLGNLVHPLAVMVRRPLVDGAGGFDESIRYNEDWDLFLRLSRRGARWASIGEALGEYRVHSAQATRRATQMLADRIRILEKTFADLALPAEAAVLRPRALQEAYLVGAADYYRAGAGPEGQAAFHAAARARPAWLTEPRSLRRFCRLLGPPGTQRQAIAAANWRAVTETLRGALAELFAAPDLEPAIARVRWRAHIAALVATATLAYRRWVAQ